MRLRTVGPILSVLVHGGILLGVARLPKTVAKRASLVSVVDKKKKKPDADKPAKADEPPPPPPKPIEAPKPAPKKVAAENTPPPPTPAAPAAAHQALAALPNLGLSLSGGPGAPGGVGIAVPTGPVADPAAAAGPARVDALKVTKPKDDCAEDAVKPKLLGAIAQDRIIAAAQSAGGVEGKIRLELLVDEAGNVTSARILAGLGGSVDDAALSAARRVKVSASTRCGKPVAGRLVVAITVRNPD